MTVGPTEMPFDMLAGDLEDSVSHAEEAILTASYSEEYPQLSLLWEEFYDGPKISPDRATLLANELDVALTNHVIPHDLCGAATRLSDFFRRAGNNGTWIQCRSD